jgi:propionyl-CoA carboxylase beta chain
VHNFGLEKRKMPGDGVVCATGYVDGRPVAAFAQDFTVGGGAVGAIHAKKICDLLDFAIKAGMPVVGINDSGGARIQEGIEGALRIRPDFLPQRARLRRDPADLDHRRPLRRWRRLLARAHRFHHHDAQELQHVHLRPDVIKAATGQTASLDQFASADAHATVSGNIHLIAEDDEHAMANSPRNSSTTCRPTILAIRRTR